jgi:hypothetical protein
MTTMMVQTCKEKTLSHKHTSDQLSESEKTQFANCIQKYFEAPNHIMGAINQQMGGGQGGF